MQTDIWGEPIPDKTEVLAPITSSSATTPQVQHAYAEVIELVSESPDSVNRDPDLIKAILYLARCVDQCTQAVAATPQLQEPQEPSKDEPATQQETPSQSGAITVVAPKQRAERNIKHYIAWGVIALLFLIGVACLIFAGGLGSIGTRLG